MITSNTNATVLCSVVFMDIVGFSKLSVQGQLVAKEHFKNILSAAISDTPVAERVVLDTGDGGSISFLSDPEPALIVAIRMRAAARATTSIPVRIGINLGPAQIVNDLNGQTNLLGDGINTAERIMSFSAPGSIMVSRSYYEAVSRLTDEYLSLFSPVGVRFDKHERPHEVFTVGEVSSNFIAERMASMHAPPTHDKPPDIEVPAAIPANSGVALQKITSTINSWFAPGTVTIATILLVMICRELFLLGDRSIRFPLAASALFALFLTLVSLSMRSGKLVWVRTQYPRLTKLFERRTLMIGLLTMTAFVVVGITMIDLLHENSLVDIQHTDDRSAPQIGTTPSDTASRPILDTVPVAEKAQESVPVTANTFDKNLAVSARSEISVPANGTQASAAATRLPLPSSKNLSAQSKPTADVTGVGQRARCSNMINRAALGETLSPEEQTILRTQCK